MTEALWALAGVVLGMFCNWFLQSRQHAHENKMYLLQNGSTEAVKAILLKFLNHSTFTDRKFTSIKKAVGGYSDDEVRKLLHEVGARKTSRDGEEWWYLLSREKERIAKKSKK